MNWVAVCFLTAIGASALGIVYFSTEATRSRKRQASEQDHIDLMNRLEQLRRRNRLP